MQRGQAYWEGDLGQSLWVITENVPVAEYYESKIRGYSSFRGRRVSNFRGKKSEGCT